MLTHWQELVDTLASAALEKYNEFRIPELIEAKENEEKRVIQEQLMLEKVRKKVSQKENFENETRMNKQREQEEQDRLKRKEILRAKEERNEQIKTYRINNLCHLTDELLSTNLYVRNAAMEKTFELARDGNKVGLEALEAAIKIKHGGNCSFHKPGVTFGIGNEYFNAPQKILDLALKNQLWTSRPDEVQQLISMTFSNWLELLKKIMDQAGDDQAHAFQLLGTHIQVNATLQKYRSRESSE